MPYLQSYRGDYLGGYRGDPGLFGTIFGGIKRIAGIASKVLPGPVGIAAGALAGLGTRRVTTRMNGGRRGGLRPVVPMPGIRAGIQRLVPGGQTGLGVAGATKGDCVTPGGLAGRLQKNGHCKAIRTMRVANTKALRRAMSREEGFVKLAKRALKGTKYAVVTRGSRAPRRVSVRESGPGSVIVR